jgi:pimeloyl-ACP methyl ester carboxylesterase
MSQMAQVRTPLKVVLMRQAFRLLGVLAPALAANWAYREWYSTRRFRESAHDARWRRQARLQLLESRFGKVAVYYWGEQTNPVVLCVHGWNGRASQFATMLPALLKAGYQVVAFDAPGHGLSEGNSTNIFRISEALTAVAGQYPTLQAIISHSFGGMVAAHAIKHQGISVQKLIMIASPVSTRYLIDIYAQTMAIDPRVMQRFDKMIRHEFGDDVYDRVSVEQNLKNNELPILVIHDKNDTSVSWRNSERIVEVAANAAVIYTEGHGHRRLLRDKKLIKKMVSFIKTGAVVT